MNRPLARIPPRPRWKPWIHPIVLRLAIGCVSGLCVESAPAAQPLSGQIVVDAEHPQWLERQGGRHVFICGPGDPEGFLYLGKRRPDGTRDGDQAERIRKLAEHGGNCIYMQIVRSHGGDAKGNGDPEWMRQNPFVDGDPARGLDEDILNQWESWFRLMDRHEILIYLFFYDDSARIWDTGDAVGPEEKAFVEAIVRKFKHHKNLIWIVGEESEERYTTARVQGIARVIRSADDHGHIIGNHHLSGTTFKAWQDGGALDHFAMQLGKGNEAAHAGAIEALAQAAGRYQIIYSENTATPENAPEWRRYAWSIATAGLMPMLMRMDIASTPVELLQQFRHLQKFFEATDFWTMSSHDELKHDGTKYVLADPGRSYIAYADTATGSLGLEQLPAGRYALTWLDCVTGKTAAEETTVARAGAHAFARPAQIGAECAVAIRRMAMETTLIEDSLQGRTKGEQVGGALGAEGYRPGLGPNHILYELPQTVREGYVEFEVRGMDAAAVPKNGNHGFLGMYDGRGVTEPATYFKDLKSNFYRWNVHWRQNRGGMKCVVSCAAPTGQRRGAAVAQFGEKRDWSHEPMGKPVQWDPAKWHRFRVEWKDKTFRVLVDGEEKWHASGPHDYAPVKHRIWLGSAPAKDDKYPCLVKDIVYRNFKVVACVPDRTTASDKAAAPQRAEAGKPGQNRTPARVTAPFKDGFEAGLGPAWTFPRTAELWRGDWISLAPAAGRNGSAGVRLRSRINRAVHAVIGDFAQPAWLDGKQRLIVEADVKIEPENRLKIGLFLKGRYFPSKHGAAQGKEPVFFHNGYAFVIAPRSVTRLAHNVWLIRRCEEGGLHAKCGGMEKERGDRYVAGATHPIETGRWHRLRVEIEGLEFSAFIDGKKVIAFRETENFYARDNHHVALYMHRNNHKPGEDDYEGDIYDKSHIGSGVFDNVSVAYAPTLAKSATNAPAGAKAGANHAPVALDKKITIFTARETFVQLAIEDDDGPGPYSYALVRAPAHGTLSGDGNDRFYTSKPGFTGNDGFVWKVNDGKADSKTATVALRVIASNENAPANESAPRFYFPPPGETLAWQDRREPRELGLKPEIVARLREQLKAGRWALWRHGYLVHVEGNFNELTEVKSLRKTWHALTVGAAIGRGKIPSLQQKLSVWNPELTGKNAGATWWHVITQTSGFDYPYAGQPACKPGEIWTYSDKNPVQLCNALARVYGRKDFTEGYDGVVRAAYFDAIGLRGWKTSLSKDGVRFHFDLEDMGRLGLLVLARGEWNGQRIIPRDFVEALETKQTRGIKANYFGPDDGAVGDGWLRGHHEKSLASPYGYMTWVNTDGDLFPGADRAWAHASGALGAAVLWNHRNGIVFAGLGVDTRRGTGGIAGEIESCIAGANPLADADR